MGNSTDSNDKSRRRGVTDGKKITESPMPNVIKERQNSRASRNLNYLYLEQIRDYTYKDVVLADTKAGFAITIVAVSLAVCAALFDKLSSVIGSWAWAVDLLWISGLASAALSMFCSMLAILPRSYISHEMADDLGSWVHVSETLGGSLRRRILDAIFVIFENIWQRQSKGTTQSLKLLLESGNEETMISSLHASMRRALLVQNLKFLWVGKGLLFSFISFSLISTSSLLAIGVSSENVVSPTSGHSTSIGGELKSNGKFVCDAHDISDVRTLSEYIHQSTTLAKVDWYCAE